MKLRMKVGPHEFEADGSEHDVEQRYAEWRTLLREAHPETFISAPWKMPHGLLGGAHDPSAFSGISISSGDKDE